MDTKVLYTLEDIEGNAVSYDIKGFNDVLIEKMIVGYVNIPLGDEKNINVPLLKGYNTPYDYTIEYEHYIYYEETDTKQKM